MALTEDQQCVSLSVNIVSVGPVLQTFLVELLQLKIDLCNGFHFDPFYKFLLFFKLFTECDKEKWISFLGIFLKPIRLFMIKNCHKNQILWSLLRLFKWFPLQIKTGSNVFCCCMIQWLKTKFLCSFSYYHYKLKKERPAWSLFFLKKVNK